MTRPDTPPAHQIQVIDRAVALMRQLALADGRLGLRELARRTDLSPSTARRILASLCQHHLCEQADDGGYQLGLTLFELGRSVEAKLDLRTRSLPALRRLSEASHLTAFLCVQSEGRAIAVERIDGRYASSLALKIGGSLPLHAGAAPVALLAWQPEDEARASLERSRPLEQFTPATLADVDAAMEYAALCRARGYVVSDEDVTPGAAALAMPVFGHASGDRAVAAVSISGLLPQVLGDGLEERLELLREAADAISRALGHGLSPVGDVPAGLTFEKGGVG